MENTTFLPEGRRFETAENAARIASYEALAAAALDGSVLEAPVRLCDAAHDLYVTLPCMDGIIPHDEGAVGIAEGTTRDIALISRVGKPVAFTVSGFEHTADGTLRAVLSRRDAQERCRAHYRRTLHTGDILSARVTRLESFGAFCDIGCGALGLLGTRRICMSRPAHAADCLRVGQRIFTAVRTLDPVQRRVTLTMRELLGTWQENAARFRAGQTVTGIVRTVTDYGAFIALTPNLCGLAETDGRLRPGQAVCVFIRAILPETLRIKLTVLHPLEALPPQALVYTRTEGHLDLWRYGTPDRAKAVTIF